MPIHSCPYCRCGHDEAAERDAQIAARVETFARECEARGWPVVDARVSESTAANLLRIPKRTLAGWRSNGNDDDKPSRGPCGSRKPVRGSQYSYDLEELAAWEVMMQFGESWKTG